MSRRSHCRSGTSKTLTTYVLNSPGVRHFSTNKSQNKWKLFERQRKSDLHYFTQKCFIILTEAKTTTTLKYYYLCYYYDHYSRWPWWHSRTKVVQSHCTHYYNNPIITYITAVLNCFFCNLVSTFKKSNCDVGFYFIFIYFFLVITITRFRTSQKYHLKAYAQK